MKKAIAVLLCLLMAGCAPRSMAAYKEIDKKQGTAGEAVPSAAPSAAPAEVSQEAVPEEPAEQTGSEETPDVDITGLNATMTYSMVLHIMQNPDEYLGKTMKICGIYNAIPMEEGTVYVCIIPDATACCVQGFEFRLEEGDEINLPEDGSEVTIFGTFDTYTEDMYLYCVLERAHVVL